MSVPSHRNTRVNYIGNICKNCDEAIHPRRITCGRCERYSYCSQACQDDDWIDHRTMTCRPHPRIQKYHISLLSYRLLHSATRFTDIYHPEIAVAALHGIFCRLDTFIGVEPESSASFVERFHSLIREEIWLITLQEKNEVSREVEPKARDVQYQKKSGKLISKLKFPRKDVAIQQLQVNMDHDLAPNGTLLIIGVFVDDKDGVGQADLSIIAPVPDIPALQHAYLSTAPEEDLLTAGL